MVVRPPTLLTRDRYREGVFKRDKDRCVHCGAEGVKLDAHHILERSLFDDGGYYLDNGVSLCEACHLLAEQTLISCEQLRAEAGITRVVLPTHFYQGDVTDKWGNTILPNGKRLRGELYWDDSVQRVLAPVLDVFTRLVKPSRTMHFPFSPGRTTDDRTLRDTSFFHGKRVVVTLKYDGENTTVMGPDGYAHARSTDPLGRPEANSRMLALAELLGRDIPDDWRVVGENLTVEHSIRYRNLPPVEHWFFRPFNIWNHRNECLPWDEVVEYCALLSLEPVPVLWRGVWDEKVVRGLMRETFDGDPMEGYVVRLEDGFRVSDYRRAVAKYVRPDHNRCEGKRHQRLVFNQTAAA